MRPSDLPKNSQASIRISSSIKEKLKASNLSVQKIFDWALDNFLEDPRVNVELSYNEDILKKAQKGDISVLNHPLVAVVDQSGYSALHYLARLGKVEVLQHPKVDKVENPWGYTPLHCLAQLGKIEVLKHPSVDSVVCYNSEETPLHTLAGNCTFLIPFSDSKINEILKHPSVAVVKGGHGRTPLHILAKLGWVETLKHPMVDKVKDADGYTPIQLLALAGKIEVLDHPLAETFKDSFGFTFLHILADQGSITKEWLEKRYPWFEVGNRKIDSSLIFELLATPPAVKFIGSL